MKGRRKPQMNTDEHRMLEPRKTLKARKMDGRYFSCCSCVSWFSYNSVQPLRAFVPSCEIYDADGAGGKMRFTGSTTDEAWVTVAGVAAKKLAGNRFEAWVEMLQGDNTVPITAMTLDKVMYTENYKVTVPTTEPQTFTYDADGNVTSVGTSVPGSPKTYYEWDAHNRLTKITHEGGTVIYSHPTNPSLAPLILPDDATTEFTYDALGRRTRIIEKRKGYTIETKANTIATATFGDVIKERRFLWVPGSNQPVEERNGRNETTRRYFAQGEQVVGAKSPDDKLFYMVDHLGSVRGLVNNNFTSQTTYDYDPYGRRTKVSGTLDTVVGYTGHHYHERSGLYLTWYRQYDPNLGRWLSRDPIGERGGKNLYGYIRNNPTNGTDPLGLFGDGGPDSIFPGHWDFTTPNGKRSYIDRQFDYAAQDHGNNRPHPRGNLLSSQFWSDVRNDAWNPAAHFQNMWATVEAVNSAIEECDTRAYSNAMHNHQDTFVHWANGYRWEPWRRGLWGLGHGIDTQFFDINPDNDVIAWQGAEDETQRMNAKWKKKCCKSILGGWIKRR